MAWTPERVEILKKMWSEGLSASQIAGELGGVTRNAVIGKVHRLGLSNRGTPATSKEQKLVSRKVPAKEYKTQKNSSKSKTSPSQSENASNGKVSNQPLSETITKGSSKQTFQSTNKSIIFTANQPLPPQPSTSEISEETLKNVQSIEKKSKKLSLMELTERTCKWPIGDPATEEFWFCGHTAEQGKPYCETHIEIAFQPVTSRRERRAR
jgi:GcrA cell cycle regulator